MSKLLLVLSTTIALFSAVSTLAAGTTIVCAEQDNYFIKHLGLTVEAALRDRGYVLVQNCTGDEPLAIQFHKKLRLRLDAPWDWHDGRFHLVQVNCIATVRLIERSTGKVISEGRDDSSFWSRYQERDNACGYAVSHAILQFPTTQ